MAQKMTDVREWLESLSIPASRGRIDRYARVLRKFADCRESGTAEEWLARRGTGDLLNALIEAQELIVIHDELRARTNSEIERRLTACYKGPADARDEQPQSSSNRARNITFELYLGSQLLRAGLEVVFHSTGDLRFHALGREFFVECKRPQSAASVERLHAEAVRQLAARFSSASNPQSARGLVAISATKMFMGDSRIIPVSDRTRLDRYVRKAADQFFSGAGSATGLPSDNRVVATLVDIRALFRLDRPNSIEVGGNLSLAPVLNLPSQDEPVVQALATQINAGIRP